jgi:hypothetical protein
MVFTTNTAEHVLAHRVCRVIAVTLKSGNMNRMHRDTETSTKAYPVYAATSSHGAATLTRDVDKLLSAAQTATASKNQHIAPQLACVATLSGVNVPF